VQEKNSANFCEFFDHIKRDYLPKGAANSREQAARDALKRLFGD